MLKLHTVSRDHLYNARAIYDKGDFVVLKGSQINMKQSSKFHPSTEVVATRANRSMVDVTGMLLCDVPFHSLSTAATFVTGRVSNEMSVWKTEDGRYVRYTLKPENDTY